MLTRRPRLIKTCSFLFLFLCLTVRPAAAAERTLLVSAAISLKDVLARLGTDFERINGRPKVLFNFAGTGQLRAQIENGAPVDVFIAASHDDMDILSRKGMIIPASQANLAANRLVLITKRGKHALDLKNIHSLVDKKVRQIAIGNPDTVPAGHYAQQALNHYRLYDLLRPKLILGENVRQVLDYVVRGEVDAGLVYATDAATENRVVVDLTLPAETHQPIVYPIAIIRSSKNPQKAWEYLKFLQSPGSAQVFREYGFEQRK